MNIADEAASCRDALMKVLAYADLRKHLADDEHRDPLPIYGAARWFDRQPIAARAIDRKEHLRITRGMMEPDWVEMLPGINNEEGC